MTCTAFVMTPRTPGAIGVIHITGASTAVLLGDVAFLHENPELVDGAIVDLIARLDVQTFMMEVSASIKEEAMLQDACFDGVPAIVVTGRETTSLWQRGVEAEAARLGLPLAYLPSGDALCIYQSPVEFFDLLERYL